MRSGTGLGAVKGRMFRMGHLGDSNDLTLVAMVAGVEMGLKLAGVALACARAIAIPAVGVALVAASVSGSLAAATSALVTAPVLLGFALVAGTVLGVLAVLAERLSPERGRRMTLDPARVRAVWQEGVALHPAG